MNAAAPDPSAPHVDGRDAWLDALLVDERAAHIDDAGFTAQVMSALPAAVPVPAWRRPAVAVLWLGAAGLACFAIPGSVHDIARAAFTVLASQPVSPVMIVGALGAAAAAMWSAVAYASRV
ncbi:MAG: hypothetical protein JSR18_08345, partial [Proteobacteria bacterium]|nr:hypothetical protein [Pseudomonadota bacterium]